MKCPKCGGTGEIQICEMGFIGKDECDKCHGKGYLTNEEWFCSLDTEDKAREISDMTAQGYWSEELVERWLKEIHE